jgi:hypothetical protein
MNETCDRWFVSDAVFRRLAMSLLAMRFFGNSPDGPLPENIEYDDHA